MLRLEVITPTRAFLSTECNSVTLPGIEGDLGILPGHTPIMTALRPGIVAYNDGSDKYFMVAEGFIEVVDDQVNVICDVARSASEVDPTGEASLQAEIKAKMAALKVEDVEFERLNHELEKSLISQSLLK
jgi:F-type H+-transporting ATPase subunit epsilon